ncbi:hypothetical protein Acor_05190 [Acrocarpospora corrugata]|uniref:Uncharacterized protein n=1 Tax=Acrocarpospora corrugata TaxID=35763 RepID=A0A5M3VVM8_9ACTN|nr:hypothetical protein [Acrocarpospora corrugata]GER98457.1 hypothetical protein Acor_05190 [Acrocarpospora corrugata]
MGRSIKGNSALARPYRDLVWLAYLTLPPDGGERRLLLAHQLAARALLRRPDDLPAARLLVLTRALRHRFRPWLGVARRLEVVPAVVRSDEHAFTTALESLPAPARAAYAMTRLEGLPPEETRRILGQAAVQEPSIALALVDALEDEHGPAGPHRPAADPTLARVYGRAVPRWLTALGTVAVLLAAASIPYWLDSGAPAKSATATLTLRRVPAGTWTTTTTLDVRAWHPRGALIDDRRLTTRALRAWQGSVRPEALYGISPAPPTSDPQLLYADLVDGGTIVLMRDPGRIARYAESRGVASLEIFPEPRAKPDGSSPLKLSGSRYLLPPWVEEISTAVLSRLGAQWKAIAVSDGVTAPIPPVQTGACWRGPVLRLRAPKVAHGLPYTMIDFGRLALANVYHQPPPPAEIDRYGPPEIDTSLPAFTAWAYLGCSLPFPPTEVQAATAWEFWSGPLPEQATGRWLCTRFTNTDGTNTTRATLLANAEGRTTVLPTGERTNTWDCSRLERDITSGTWWKAPSGRWYYLAAGSRQITQLSIAGLGVTDSTLPATFAALPGPLGGTTPRSEITLKATTSEGTIPPVFQQTYEP